MCAYNLALNQRDLFLSLLFEQMYKQNITASDFTVEGLMKTETERTLDLYSSWHIWCDQDDGGAGPHMMVTLEYA